VAQLRAGRLAGSTLAVLLASSVVWAQRRGSTIIAPGADSAPIFLTGRVVLDDGTPPPDPVGIERVCHGAVRAAGYTDSKGLFSIPFGMSPGPNTKRGFGELDLSVCDLRASLEGYKSDEVSLAGRQEMDNPDVGTLVLHRYTHGEGNTVSSTSLVAPKEAANALRRGREAARKEKWDEARKQFEKAVQIYPKYASAWCELGRTLEELQDESGAWNAYQRAIASDERFIPPYVRVADLDLKRHDWAGAIETADHVVKLDPLDFPSVYLYRSFAQFSLQDLEGAEKSARQVLDLDKGHRYPAADHLLGLLLALRGDLSGAAVHLRAYLRLAPNAPDAAVARVQLAGIEQSGRPTLPGTP
jgi:tetratricopeptide (TPR) repeat protein